ncbi:MAG TPA: type II toxin-antitoxin system RelE/ParE family toxin [Thermodesulfobacteriota bacterium]|nr:type II toxin-antitoxin system RelE/ParE family toxin [Thermodesulfobacteriota bacterium]
MGYLILKIRMLKPIIWIGSSLKDLKEFPKEVQREIGYALYRAQIGKKHHKTKPLKGFGDVIEIVSDYDKDTYRAVCAYKFVEEIYVLHAFKKKSKKGIQIPKEEIEVIRQRLKRAKEIAGEK